jgi:hypothetical protein
VRRPGGGAPGSGQRLPPWGGRGGDRKKALIELDEAVRRKLPNPDHIGADPGFASLRDDPEFQKIAARAAHP